MGVEREACLHRFWSSFGIPAYDERTINPDARMPYITYEAASGYFDDSLSLSASLWYHDTDWTDITLKGDEIGRSIGRGGIMRPYEGGAMWVTRGSPFIQRMSDPNDSTIRRLRLSVNIEFLSGD